MNANLIDDFNALSPEWQQWLCEALSARISQAQISEILTEQGHHAPQRLIEAAYQHPLCRWAIKQSVNAQQRALFLRLHHELWTSRQINIQILDAPSKEIFYTRCYDCSRPAIIRNWVNEWPSYSSSLWSPSTWIERFANAEIEVVSGRNSHDAYDRCYLDLIDKCTLGEFAQWVLQNPMSNDRYLIARNRALDEQSIAPIFDGISDEPYMKRSRRSGCVALWFGPAQTVTPLHHDTCNIMFAQLRGKKSFILVPPSNQDLFESSVNMYVDRDLDQDPVPEQIKVTVNQGEALFIPIGWWHQVRSTEISVSVGMTHFEQVNRYPWFEPGRLVNHQLQNNDNH